MISLIEWAKTVAITKQKPSQDSNSEITSKGLIDLHEGLITLRVLANKLGVYAVKDSLTTSIHTVEDKLRDIVESYKIKNYVVPSKIINILKLESSLTISLDDLKKLCDINNLLIVNTSLLLNNSPYIRSDTGEYCLISINNLDITKITHTTKPYYVGSSIRASLSNTLMYLPVIASMSDATQKHNLYSSIREDIKTYIDMLYPDKVLGSLKLFNGVVNLDIEGINDNAYKFKSTTVDKIITVKSEPNTPVVYEGVLISNTETGFTFEGSTREYQTLSAAKSGIRAYLKEINQ